MTSIREILKHISVTNLPEAHSVKFTEEEDRLARLQTMTYQPGMYLNFKGVSTEMAHGVETLLQKEQNVEKIREACDGLEGASDCQDVSNGSTVSFPSATTPKNSKGSTIGK